MGATLQLGLGIAGEEADGPTLEPEAPAQGRTIRIEIPGDPRAKGRPKTAVIHGRAGDLAAIPRMPQALELQVLELIAGGRRPSLAEGEPGLVIAPPEPRPDPAAAQLLPALEAACRRGDLATVRRWLLALVVCVRNAPEGDALEVRIAAIAGACADLPAAVWSAETSLRAARTWQWWPTPADVHAFLLPEAERVRARRDAVRRIAEASARPAKEPERSARDEDPLDRERCARLAREAIAELTCGGPEAKPAPAALPLSDGHLLAEYERLAAAGNRRAATRAEAIRRRMAAQAGTHLAPEDARDGGGERGRRDVKHFAAAHARLWELRRAGRRAPA